MYPKSLNKRKGYEKIIKRETYLFKNSPENIIAEHKQ